MSDLDPLTEKITAMARAFIVAEVGEDHGDMMTAQAQRFAQAIRGIIREAQADAWAAGWHTRADHDNTQGGNLRGPNPYRKYLDA